MGFRIMLRNTVFLVKLLIISLFFIVILSLWVPGYLSKISN